MWRLLQRCVDKAEVHGVASTCGGVEFEEPYLVAGCVVR